MHGRSYGQRLWQTIFISFSYSIIKAYHTKEIMSKCVYMKFTEEQDMAFIAEIPNFEEKDL